MSCAEYGLCDWVMLFSLQGAAFGVQAQAIYRGQCIAGFTPLLYQDVLHSWCSFCSWLLNIASLTRRREMEKQTRNGYVLLLVPRISLQRP